MRLYYRYLSSHGCVLRLCDGHGMRKPLLCGFELAVLRSLISRHVLFYDSYPPLSSTGRVLHRLFVSAHLPIASSMLYLFARTLISLERVRSSLGKGKRQTVTNI